MNTGSAVVIAIWGLLLGPAARGATVVLTPSKDNTIVQWSAESPEPNPLLANGQGDIFVGRTNQDGQEEPTISIRRGLVHFDVAAVLPSGVTVTSVKLTMRDVMGLNGDPLVTLHRMVSDWGEGASFFPGGRGAPAEDGDVTWFHAFYAAAEPGESIPWTTPGGDFSTTVSGASVVSDDQGAGQLFSWTNAGMAADVQAWLANPNQNFGWMIRGDEAHGQTAKRLNSRDSATPPLLEIEYTLVLAGDYNDDGLVDAADYTVWRNHLGEEIRLPNETATFGTVDAADYIEWKANYGTAEESASGTAMVPEPGCVAIASALAAMSAASRRRR